MSDIDALTEEAAAAQYESSKWPYYQEEVRVAARGRVRPTVVLVAARVEQDVFDGLEALAWDEVAVGDQSYFNLEHGETGPELIGRFLAAARVARGGSDVG